jgi:uncharacterized membrane protein HdeD (DUF308 family)
MLNTADCRSARLLLAGATSVQSGLVPRADQGHSLIMLNIVSIIIGLVALLFAIPAFLPILALAYYLIIPLAIVGAVIGAASSSNVGRNLNLAVIVIGVLRLMLGGGIF